MNIPHRKPAPSAVVSFLHELELSTLKGTIECAPAMITITDDTGVVEYVNTAFETFTGYAKQEIVGHPIRLLRSDEERPAIYEEMWSAILNGHAFVGTVENRKKNGEKFLAERTIVPMPQPDGHIRNFVFYDQDLTDQRIAENLLQQVQRMQALQKVAREIAHDFNNLLMIMSANAELVLNSLTEQSPSRSHVQQVILAARRAGQLTQQLVTLASSISNQAVARKESTGRAASASG